MHDNVPDAPKYPIGVIIPTYNRAKVLLTCLKHLEHQTWTDFEVIVVDDGSTDSTPELVKAYQSQSSLRIRYFRQGNSGPARARNVAISQLRSRICLMIGDDILASETLIARHLGFHERNPQLQIAGLGLTCWSNSEQTVTRFMHWIDESGLQFSYRDLLSGTRPDWKHFYTSNLSLKTAFLRSNPFNESFRNAAMEDIELGYRLESTHSLQMEFIPEALAFHVHPTSVRQACRRMFLAGISARLFHDIWPTSAPAGGPLPRQDAVRKLLLRHEWLLSPLTSVASLLTAFWCPNPLMRYMLTSHYSLGYLSSGRRPLLLPCMPVAGPAAHNAEPSNAEIKAER